MAESHHEEEVLGKAYDARLMRRLLTYLCVQVVRAYIASAHHCERTLVLVIRR
jgi:hypothetical protein